ncbi:hypothetical protein BDR06DRAFT_1067076 [Suillus hirtellus]|nr:hypothetical protein BDR06DRAFT_1067076 [Suillus hirtellus]
MSTLLGFTKVNNAHSSKQLGGALFKILNHIEIAQKLGHVTYDNAANNGMTLQEFMHLYEAKYNKVFPWCQHKINCLAHIINLATQSLISTYSKALYYNPHKPKSHKLTTWDEIALVQRTVICEAKGNVLECADQSHQEHNLTKCAKINFLQLSAGEWTHIGQFTDLLSYADVTQQAFSSECGSTLHLTIPALKTLYRAWSSCAKRSKYAWFTPLLQAAAAKVDEYYERTMQPPAYIMAMCTVEEVFKACYHELNEEAMFLSSSQPTSKKSEAGGLKSLICKVISDLEDNLLMNPTPTSIGDPSQPWRAEFMSYLETIEVALPADIQYGPHSHKITYPSCHHQYQASAHFRKVASQSANDRTGLKETLWKLSNVSNPGSSSLVESEACDDSELEADSEERTDVADEEDAWDALILDDDEFSD